MADKFDYDENGLDDVVVENVSMFRLERMNSGSYWLRCYRDGADDVVFWLNSDQKITGRHELD